MTVRLFSSILLLLTAELSVVPNTNAQPTTCPGGEPLPSPCNCMKDLSGFNNPSCSASDFSFSEVNGFVVYDKLSQDPCNCNCWNDAECAAKTTPVDCRPLGSPISCGEFDIGTVFGACLGNDDNVNVSLTVSFSSNGATSDVGLYMSVGSNSALSGQCLVTVLSPGTYATSEGGSIQVVENNGNNCPDIVGSGTLINYPINNIIFPCYDGSADGYLDFDLALGKSFVLMHIHSFIASFKLPHTLFAPVYGGTVTDGSGNGKTW